jgi:hypothetical protein
VIRTGKDTGLGHFPSRDYGLNKAWLDASMTACILLSWLRHLALDGKLAKAEPKTLRYPLFHTAARLVRGGRRKTLKIAATWPWATAISTAWKRIQALPHPSDQRKPSLLSRKEAPGSVEPPATGPTAGPSASSDTRKPLPEALVAPFRQTPQQHERSRLMGRGHGKPAKAPLPGYDRSTPPVQFRFRGRLPGQPSASANDIQPEQMAACADAIPEYH